MQDADWVEKQRARARCDLFVVLFSFHSLIFSCLGIGVCEVLFCISVPNAFYHPEWGGPRSCRRMLPKRLVMDTQFLPLINRWQVLSKLESCVAQAIYYACAIRSPPRLTVFSSRSNRFFPFPIRYAARSIQRGWRRWLMKHRPVRNRSVFTRGQQL